MHPDNTSNTHTVTAGIYCRLSVARGGSGTEKIEDQERISRDLATARGWEVSGVYIDNSRSAWQKNRKRPGWDAMLADVEAGRLGALVVYHGDRLIRQPFDLEKLLNLADGRGIHLAAPTGTRDLDSSEDRFILRIEAAMACRESDNTSRRKKAQYRRMRAKGLVRSGGRGGRAFGFETDGVTHIEKECELVRAAARRVLAGESIGRVARWLNAMGAQTPAGRPFTHGTVRKMLARPRYAGLMPDSASPAAWEPVLERNTWETVRSILDTRADGFAYATNARRYLLSGIARCGECGCGLQARAAYQRPGSAGYGCVELGCRKVFRSVQLLDAYVITRTVARLSNPANPPGRVPDSDVLAAEFQALTRQRAEAEAAAVKYAESPRLDLLMARLDSIDARLAELRELASGNARARLLDAHAGITRGEFDGLELSARRALVSACFTISVLPASKRGPGFRTEDVRLMPR